MKDWFPGHDQNRIHALKWHKQALLSEIEQAPYMWIIHEETLRSIDNEIGRWNILLSESGL